MFNYLLGTKVYYEMLNRNNSSQSARMHVCMLVYSFYESDYRVRRYAEVLAQQGHAVDVICLRKPKESNFTTDSGVRLIRIQRRSINEHSKLSYLFKLLSFLVKSFVVLSLIHARRRYHLIHVHNPPDFLVFSTLIPKLTGAKIILDIHDILPEFYASKFNRGMASLGCRSLLLIEKLSAKWADRVILANHIWYSRYVSRSAEPVKCTVIINYPNTRLFSNRQSVSPRDGFRFIYPGSLNWHQGLDVAVRAFSSLSQKEERCRLEIFGDGPGRRGLVDLIAKLGLGKRVCMHDPVPISEMPGVMAKADCGIVPKRADGFGGEAFSTKILEFMAMGIPVIASETPIDRHYFDDSMILFFKSGDAQELAEKMERIMADSALRKSLIDRGMTYSRENSWEEKKTLYSDLVHSLFDSGKTPASVRETNQAPG